MIASQRIHTVEDDAGGDPVVAVPAEEVAVRSVRVLRDDEIGAPAADLTRNIQPKTARVLHLAILVTEKLHVLDAENPGGASLLSFPDPHQLLGHDGPVA
jgi:hypothetical protein